MSGRARTGIALVLFLLLTACSGTEPPAESPAAHAPPAPVDYQARLARTDQDIAAAFEAINHAPDLPTLTRTVLSAAGVVGAAGEQLAAGGPVPPELAQANNGLVAGLGELARQLAFLSQQINLRVICTGQTALNAITTAPSMAGLRASAANLPWGGWLPAPRDPVDARPANGRLVVDRRVPGQPAAGVLEVRNDGSSDAVLTLARNGAAVVSVAVGAGAATRLADIPDGDYELYYTTGRDWDDVVGGFGRQCDFRRFVEPTSYGSKPVPGGTAYTVQTVTLRSTGEGEPAAGTADVPPDRLPR